VTWTPPAAKWETWASVGDCELWKAVVLTFGYEPRFFDLHREPGGDLIVASTTLTFGRIVAVQQTGLQLVEAIGDRLMVATSNIGSGVTITGRALGVTVSRSKVFLPDFWTWAEGIFPDLPLGYRAGTPKAVTVPSSVASQGTDGGVTISLPHSTKALEAIFEVMRKVWMTFDPKNPPKQTAIAVEIDEAMGRSHPPGKPTRAAETIAGLIRPDGLAEKDSRASRHKPRR
jgi:hypothetical protein